jgi:ABC-type glycerol-3-phosphate transport system substrate-binding protein
MKTIIKILAAALILTACFNASRAALTDYQFQDAVHEGLVFDGLASDAEIANMVRKLAAAYEIPIADENIVIRQVGQDVHVDMSYTRNVVLVPGVFARDWTFTPSTSNRILVGQRRQ